MQFKTLSTKWKWPLRGAIVVLLFFGSSLTWKVVQPGQRAPTLPEPQIRLGAPTQLKAASNNWTAVRSIATFLQNATNGVDEIIVSLQNSGALNANQVITATRGDFKYRFNPSFDQSVVSTAFPSGKTYNVSFEVWRSTDDSKYLELYFTTGEDAREALAIWQPNIVDTNANQGNSNKMECALSGGANDGFMVCSWNGPIASSGVVQTARFKADANSTSGDVSVRGAVQTLNASGCASGAADYYALAFISKTASPNYTTARFGFNEGSLAPTLCGTTNTVNNAYFNTNANANGSGGDQYFVQDGVATDLDANYPTSASVASYFNGLGSADSDGVDITTTALGSLSVQFRQSTSPGF